MVIVILFVLGLCLGSFVNAFVWRFHAQAELKDEQIQSTISPSSTTTRSAIKRRMTVDAAKRQEAVKAELASLSITTGRSMCVHCRHELAAKDLMPVISYVWLGGKCRYCRRPIQDTPLPELVTPLLFIVSYLAWPKPLQGASLVSFCFWLALLIGFVALSLYDYKWFELPHDIVFPLMCLALAEIIIMLLFYKSGTSSLPPDLWGAVIGGGIFSLLYRISPKLTDLDSSPSGLKTTTNPVPGDSAVTTEPGDVTDRLPLGSRVLGTMLSVLAGNRTSTWIGGGDITLGILLGLIVGGPGNALLLIFIASLLGTLLVLPLMVAGRATKSSHLPFGPLLIVAAVIVKLSGAWLISWYRVHLIG